MAEKAWNALEKTKLKYGKEKRLAIEKIVYTVGDYDVETCNQERKDPEEGKERSKRWSLKSRRFTL